MNCDKVVNIAFLHVNVAKFSSYLNSKEKVVEYLSQNMMFAGKIAVKLAGYLVNYSKKFESVLFLLTDELIDIVPNSTCNGLTGFQNQT